MVFADEDEDFKKQVQQLRESMPFAVVGANAMVEVKGKKIRGRQYPWGVIEVENPSHCDFVKLRTMLITHMQDLQVSQFKQDPNISSRDNSRMRSLLLTMTYSNQM